MSSCLGTGLSASPLRRVGFETRPYGAEKLPILATSTIKMCPFGGTDPQDRGRITAVIGQIHEFALWEPSKCVRWSGDQQVFIATTIYRTQNILSVLSVVK